MGGGSVSMVRWQVRCVIDAAARRPIELRAFAMDR